MIITMFEGRFPVILPDEWFKGAVLFATADRVQCIDFRESGGLALKFWVSFSGPTAERKWTILSETEATYYEWSVCKEQAPFVDPTNAVGISVYGNLSEPLDMRALRYIDKSKLLM